MAVNPESPFCRWCWHPLAEVAARVLRGPRLVGKGRVVHRHWPKDAGLTRRSVARLSDAACEVMDALEAMADELARTPGEAAAELLGVVRQEHERWEQRLEAFEQWRNGKEGDSDAGGNPSGPG